MGGLVWYSDGLRRKASYTREGIVYGEIWEVETEGESFPSVDNEVEYTGEALSEDDYVQSNADGEVYYQNIVQKKAMCVQTLRLTLGIGRHRIATVFAVVSRCP